MLAAPRRPRRRSPGARRTLRAVALGLLAAATAAGALAQLPPVIDELGSADRLKSQRQREDVDARARRHLGMRLRRTGLVDLDVLQRLLDERIIDADDVFGLQSLGVVLGDVMVDNLPLGWVTVDDEIGRSRALRLRDTRHLFFPVTMISKRVTVGERVRVRALYDDVARQVEAIEGRSRPSRRPRTLPERPAAENADPGS